MTRGAMWTDTGAFEARSAITLTQDYVSLPSVSTWDLDKNTMQKPICNRKTSQPQGLTWPFARSLTPDWREPELIFWPLVSSQTLSNGIFIDPSFYSQS
jgi:hypothetical protein